MCMLIFYFFLQLLVMLLYFLCEKSSCCSLLMHALFYMNKGNDSVMSDSLQTHGLSMEFSRPEYWNGQPFPSPGDHPSPGIEPRCPTLQVDSLPAEPQEYCGIPRILEWVAYPFSSGSSQPRNLYEYYALKNLLTYCKTSKSFCPLAKIRGCKCCPPSYSIEAQSVS